MNDRYTGAMAPADTDAVAATWLTGPTMLMLEIQRSQFALLASWQQAAAAVQQELWDEWVSRWGGGVPIDA